MASNQFCLILWILKTIVSQIEVFKILVSISLDFKNPGVHSIGYIITLEHNKQKTLYSQGFSVLLGKKSSTSYTLVDTHKVFAELLIVPAVRRVVALALAVVEQVNGLFAQRFREVFQRGLFRAAEEQTGVHVARNCLSRIFIHRFELSLCLQHHASRNLAAAYRRDELVEVGDLAYICEFVEQEPDMDRQLAAVFRVRFVAKQIE